MTRPLRRCILVWICRMGSCLLVTLVVLGLLVLAKTKADGEYLYHTEEADGIIHDYDDKSNLTPDFLFGLHQGPRVVEFYAPWCPHCQHFRSHYIQFAEQMNAVSAELKTPPISFHAVSCTAHHKICKEMGIGGFPKIYLFGVDAHHNQTAEVKYWKLHPFDVLTELGIQVDRGQLAPVLQATDKKDASQLRTERRQQLFARSKQEMFDDAHRSFDFWMRNGIFTKEGSLNNATKAVLVDFVELLRKSTPAVWQLQPVLKDIADNLDWAAEDERNLVSIMDKHPPPQSKWSSSCTKGVDGMGYTCGLWILFHMMTVGVVEYNSMISFTDDGLLEELSITTVWAAETLRNMIEQFFQCDYCRMNFLQSYDNCDHDRCTRLSEKKHTFRQWIELPVWLMETHNAVNLRLARERAERAGDAISTRDLDLTQWPAKDDCTTCWFEHGGWDEEMMYKFLRTEYWLEDVVTAEHRALFAPVQKVMLEPPPRFPFELFPIAVGTAIFAYWYKKRSELIKSGRHKKDDNDKC